MLRQVGGCLGWVPLERERHAPNLCRPRGLIAPNAQAKLQPDATTAAAQPPLPQPGCQLQRHDVSREATAP